MTVPSLSPASRKSRLVRVLLVDDNPQVLHDLHQLLEISGIVDVIGEAGNGLEAIRLAAALSPDVVIMDLEMPVMDGYEAAAQIKAVQPAPRVVILSVHAGSGEVERALAAGVDGFVLKGADYQILINAILGVDGDLKTFNKGEKS